MEIVAKRGSHYLYGEERLGQGREKAKAFLRENPEMAAELEGLIRDESQANSSLEESELEAPE